MKSVLIIGAGFAGTSAAKKLCVSDLGLEVIVVDKKEQFDFLPLLPDIIGRALSPRFLSCGIEPLAARTGFKFINGEIKAVIPKEKQVIINDAALNYDYLIIASGSETNFYSNENIRQFAHKLDSVADAENIAGVIKKAGYNYYIIAGAGYTGIEVATNLRLFLDRQGRNAKVIVIERAPSILGQLPQSIKDCVNSSLKNMGGIEIITNATIERIENNKVFISGSRVFDNAFSIWAAGVRTADFIQNLPYEKNPQGRIKVDEYLRVDDNCFAVGDAGYFRYKDIYLRMAVQFALTQGQCAAINIINSIKGARLRPYKPVDLGYIIPLANNNSCGTVLGFSLGGLLPTILHFLMCVYRTPGFKNKFGLVRDLI